MRRGGILVTVLLASIAVGGAAAAASPLVLAGRSVGGVAFGSPLSAAVGRLDRTLGIRGRVAPTPDLANCGVTATATWGALHLFFDRGRLVGASAGPGRTPPARTDTGLVLGETMAHARAHLGRRLTLRTDQGGAFSVATPHGVERGFLTPSNGHPTGASRVLTLDVGVVGCPAMSP